MSIINHDNFIANIVEEELFEGIPVELGINTRDISIVSCCNGLCHRELGVEHCFLNLGHRVNNCVNRMNSSTHFPVCPIIVELKVYNTSLKATSHEMLSVVILVNCVCPKWEFVEFINIC